MLPSDCALLPLASGALLVSRRNATFCRIDNAEINQLAATIREPARLAHLPHAVLERLDSHGFFAGPRPKQPDPPSVQLQLTNACNLACAYCCTNSGPPRSHELERDAWFEVVDDAVAKMGQLVQFAILGGEPFLVPWAVELADHIISLGAGLTIFTNGTALAQQSLAKQVARLVNNGAEVRVSLAGVTQTTCDRRSGASRFAQALRGLQTLADHGALAAVDLMLLPSDIDDVAEHLPALRTQLPQGTKISFGLVFHGGREQGTHTFRSRSELEEALDRIAFEAGELIPARGPQPLAHRREGCSCAIGDHLHVRSDGALFTCFKMEEQVGQLSQQSFGNTLAAVRARPRPASSLPRCADCHLATLCGGGCRAENLQLTGNADEPVCGPWRVRVLSELLAEDRVDALEWPAAQLLSEARARKIDAPEQLEPVISSLHLRQR